MSSIAGSANKLLMEAAGPHQAGLSIMGGYGHSHIREIVFGGFTQSVLESAEMTVFLIH
jgi:nucleotide-binding universal stress UspA family protein